MYLTSHAFVCDVRVGQGGGLGGAVKLSLSWWVQVLCTVSIVQLCAFPPFQSSRSPAGRRDERDERAESNEQSTVVYYQQRLSPVPLALCVLCIVCVAAELRLLATLRRTVRYLAFILRDSYYTIPTYLLPWIWPHASQVTSTWPVGSVRVSYLCAAPHIAAVLREGL